MPNCKYWQISTHDKEADVFIFGDLTSWRWEENEVSGYSLARELQEIDADVINVHIDSYGGEVSEGFAIYNVLKNHPAKIRTYADGFVASAANYPFLAGDERIASDVSAFFLHQAMTGAWGYAEDLRKAADEAEKMTETGINAYVGVGMDRDKVRELMKDETWLDGSEALALGLATAVVSSDNSRPTQDARKAILAKLKQKAEPVQEMPAEEPAEQIEEPVPFEPTPAEQVEEEKKPTIIDTIINSL